MCFFFFLSLSPKSSSIFKWSACVTWLLRPPLFLFYIPHFVVLNCRRSPCRPYSRQGKYEVLLFQRAKKRKKREERINRRPPLLSLRVYFIGRERVGREGACRPAIKDANAGSYARAAGEFCIYVSWCGRLREIYSCSKRAAVSAAFKIKKNGLAPFTSSQTKRLLLLCFFI